MAERDGGPGLERRPFWLTPEQLEWIDIQVAKKRRQVAESRGPGTEMTFVSRSTWLRDLVDEQIKAAS